MLGIDKGILVGDIELVVVDIMQEHIDPTKVIGSQIDFLAEKALADVILTKILAAFSSSDPEPQQGHRPY